MKISVFAKYQNAQNLVFKIENEAIEHGFSIDDKNPDIIIYLGGDGTFLRAIQNNIDRLDEVYFLGVNNGALGFFYDFKVDEIKTMFEMLANDLLECKCIDLLEGIIYTNEEDFPFYIFNELRVANSFSLLKCDVYINDEYFETFSGNELVISSSFGSTGLTKSIGGAVIDSNLSAIQIVPIAPLNSIVYTTFTNPLILSGDSTITINNFKNGGSVSFDCMGFEDSVKEINLKKSDLKVKVLYKKERNFVEMIKRSFIK